MNFLERVRASMSKKQWMAMGVVLVLGVMGAIAILNMDRAKSASEEGAVLTPSPSRGGQGWGWGCTGDCSSHEAHPHPNPPLEREGKTHEEHGHDHAEEEHEEDTIVLSAEQLKAAGVELDTVGPASIGATLQLPGEIRFNEDRTAHVVPRVTGVVEAVPAALGQQVRKGQVLAVISSPMVSEQRAELQAAQTRHQLARSTYEREKKLWEEKISPQQDVLQAENALREAEIAVNNARQTLQAVGASPSAENLNRFELRAPFDGTVVEKHIALGEQVKEDAQVFTITDLRTVWAQINVPAKDLPQVRVGERVTIRSSAFDQTASGIVAYVGSLIGEQTRTAQARVTVDNPKRVWRPGLFVSVEMTAGEAEVPIAVSTHALQTVGDNTVVFVQTAHGFIAQPVKTGRSDGKHVEILTGLQPGARYASNGSFVLKSEAGKASATHSH